ncbi:MAG: 3-dehydroquinate synthase [Lachnospiraceae bacterium]|nr:3-dehydroquinate synthase [Lachnospiraceae bacterium]
MNLRNTFHIVSEDSFAQLGAEIDGLSQGKGPGAAKPKICIVTDSHVAGLYLEDVQGALGGGAGLHTDGACRDPIDGRCESLPEESLHDGFGENTAGLPGVSTFIFPAGEENKTLDTVTALYEHLVLGHYQRSDLLLALGGGVVGDLCGFAAATYLRGVPFVQVPTTLLSMVDSSIGGKTGVDFKSYKNMVGAFHMPALVYLNPNTLRTLPDDQFASGMGEVVKHALLGDADYYDFLKSMRGAILARETDALGRVVETSQQIKGRIVDRDPKEKGERALLNLGHTFGHAIEKLSDFRLLHGHCVALGCVAAAKISVDRGTLAYGQLQDIEATFQSYGLPVRLGSDAAANMTKEDIMDAVRSDKKMAFGKLKFILLAGIGSAYIETELSQKEMEAGLGYIME